MVYTCDCSHQQQQNKPSTTIECNIIDVIVLYFWIYNVLHGSYFTCNIGKYKQCCTQPMKVLH